MADMDIDDFMKAHKPAGRGKLALFQGDLVRLRAEGYSLQQLCEYVAAASQGAVTATEGGMCQFFARLEAKQQNTSK